MKFLYAMLAATNLAAAKPPVADYNNQTIRYRGDKLSISDDTEIEVINKSFRKEDTKLKENLDENDKEQEMYFSDKRPFQLLLSKEQTKFLRDTKLKNVEIKISYKLKILNDGFRGETELKRIHNHMMEPKRGEDSFFDLFNDKGEKVDISFSEQQTKVIANSKPGQDALEINPLISLPKDDSYELGNIISLKITNITISGKAQVYNLDHIKMEEIKTTYDSVNNKNIIKDFVYSTQFDDFMQEAYGLPNDFVNKQKTLEKAYLDLLNHSIENKIGLNIIPNEKYHVVGYLKQDISFALTKDLFRRLPDFEAIKKVKSSNFYDQMYRSYFEPYDLDVVIDLDKNVAKLSGYATAIEFENDGELIDWNKFHRVDVIKGGKDIAQAYAGNWFVEDYVAIGDLAKSYFEKIASEKEIKNETDKPKQTIKDDELSSLESEDSLEEETSKINDEKDTSKSKTKPLKYLWLLTIPITFGLAGLISWFIPFRKKKKRSNDIK